MSANSQQSFNYHPQPVVNLFATPSKGHETHHTAHSHNAYPAHANRGDAIFTPDSDASHFPHMPLKSGMRASTVGMPSGRKVEPAFTFFGETANAYSQPQGDHSQGGSYHYAHRDGIMKPLPGVSYGDGIADPTAYGNHGSNAPKSYDYNRTAPTTDFDNKPFVRPIPGDSGTKRESSYPSTWNARPRVADTDDTDSGRSKNNSILSQLKELTEMNRNLTRAFFRKERLDLEKEKKFINDILTFKENQHELRGQLNRLEESFALSSFGELAVQSEKMGNLEKEIASMRSGFAKTRDGLANLQTVVGFSDREDEGYNAETTYQSTCC